MNVISKRNTTRANFRSSGKFSRGKDRQKWITSETPGTGLKESPSNYVFNIEFVFKWMISPLCVIDIFIFCCSLSKNGFTNAKIQSSSAISKKSCSIFSVHFLNCKYQQHLQFATLYTETGSQLHFLIAKSFNFILNALIRFIKLGNNLFLPCSSIFRWLRWSSTLTKNSKSDSQLLSQKRALSSGGSFFSSWTSWPACFKMLTDNLKWICTKQKADKILRFATLLYYYHEDAPFESSNAQNVANAP